ncbi:DUF4062 domain-containing protein [Aquipseudomonas campi]|uniref:DUF4062 domain-containing protein n=1 Tax=Aquipseudomonas campi TaxID=2731681 RepID=A0A6M8FG37_9GAMM|nr:DUF4062 domain-containing protein [Pseudomonas campi]QKE63232.1 DUF4062 domain-containing protein [Pseudomonas campi]
MASTRKVISIFLGSPGDLGTERLKVRDIVTELNALLSSRLSIQIELVGWEDTTPRYGRPQEIINQDLKRCDVFIGLIWKRWGTPTGNGDGYSSGFEEEFTLSLQSKRESDKPQISLFFKEVDSDNLKDPGDGLKKVLAFKDRMITGKEVLFQEFNNSDFESKLRACIVAYVFELAAYPSEGGLDSVEGMESIAEGSNGDDSGGEPKNTILPPESIGFFSDFIKRLKYPVEESSVDEKAVARIRLLSSVLGKARNDIQHIGAHDSNLIFADKSNTGLGTAELNGLVASALQSYEHQNIPLWCWVNSLDDKQGDDCLFFQTVIGKGAVPVNAVKAISLVGRPFPTEPVFNKDFYLALWLNDGADINLRRAALGYLAVYGKAEDASVIMREVERNDSQTNGEAKEALIRLALKSGREKALESVIELQPASIKEGLVLEIFKNAAALSTCVLNAALAHRAALIRAGAIKELGRRGAIEVESLERFYGDSDLDVRLAAMQVAFSLGRKFEEVEAEAILKSEQGGVGVGLGLSANKHYKNRGLFKVTLLESLTDAELERKIKNDVVLDEMPYIVLMSRHKKKYKKDLMLRIEDGYEDYLHEAQVLWLSRFSDSDSIRGTLRNLSGHIKRNLIRESLSLVSTVASLEDLGFFRRVLSSGSVSSRKEDFDFLGKHGEWQDIELVLKMVDNVDYGYASLLSAFADDGAYGANARFAAKTILMISKGRELEVLDMGISARVFEEVLRLFSDGSFKKLADDALLQLLMHENDACRKMAALKCVKCFTKTRLNALLVKYMEGPQQYYNSVHWLDFGVSLPKEVSVFGVGRLIGN